MRPVIDTRLPIGEVAAQAGIPTSTIRYYEKQGVLPPAERVNGRRRYDSDMATYLAVIDLLSDRGALAIDTLRELIEQNLRSQRLGLACECRFTLAEALQMDGQHDEAELELRKALGEAARQHLVKPLYELQHRQPQWLASMLPAGKGESLRDRLLQFEREPEESAASGDEIILSNRELTVLRLIAQGCSNQEIAEQLFISLHTVKTHARRINTKLGVARRTQAVARAKALAWL